MRITLVALLVACSAALRCTHTARFPLAQRRCSVVAAGGAELATLPSQLGRVASWAGEVVVVKYGGHAMTDPELSKSFAADCALMQSLGVRLVVVHGGGPQINAMLKKLEIKSEFVAGLRVTCPATMDAAEMVLCGSINKQIASSITLAGGRAVGLSGKEDKTNPSPNPDAGPNPSNLNPDPKPALSGKDDKMVTAERKVHVEEDGTEVSLGQVGEPGAVRTALLTSLLDGGIAPGHVEDRRPGALGHSRPEASAEAAPPSGTPRQRQIKLRAASSLGQPRPASASWQGMCMCLPGGRPETGRACHTGPRHRSGGHRRRRHVVQRQRGHHVGRDRRGARRASAAAAHRRRRRARCRAGGRGQAAAHAQPGRREPTPANPNPNPNPNPNLNLNLNPNPNANPEQVTRLKAEGVITGGMIPKLETACDAVSGGCGSAVIMDGRVQHCTLQHFFGEGGVGTAVVE
jgi:acetylglutamate kinase